MKDFVPIVDICSILLIHYGSLFFNDTATTEIYTLSLHAALPICRHGASGTRLPQRRRRRRRHADDDRSEEHTSELQSHLNVVCRLLLEKKDTYTFNPLSAALSVWPLLDGPPSVFLQLDVIRVFADPYFFLRHPATPEIFLLPSPGALEF